MGLQVSLCWEIQVSPTPAPICPNWHPEHPGSTVSGPCGAQSRGAPETSSCISRVTRYRPCGPLVPKPWGDQRQSRLWDRVGPLSAGPRPAGSATLAVCEHPPWVLLPWQGQAAGLVPVHVCFRGFCVCAAQGGPEGGCESWPIAGRGSGALLHPTACDRDPGSVSARPCPPGACAVGLHLPSSSQPVCSFVQMEYVT